MNGKLIVIPAMTYVPEPSLTGVNMLNNADVTKTPEFVKEFLAEEYQLFGGNKNLYLNYLKWARDMYEEVETKLDRLKWEVEKNYYSHTIFSFRNSDEYVSFINNLQEGNFWYASLIKRLLDNGAKPVPLGDRITGLELQDYMHIGDNQLYSQCAREYINSMFEDLKRDLKEGETGVLVDVPLFIDFLKDSKPPDSIQLEIWGSEFVTKLENMYSESTK